MGRAAHAGRHAVIIADHDHVVIEVLTAIPEHLARLSPSGRWLVRVDTLLVIVAVLALAKSKSDMDGKIP